MKNKVLLFGATGMAGHVAYYYLKDTGGYDITNVVSRQKLTAGSIIVDVRSKDAVEELVSEQQPDFIINCVGILIKESKEHPDNAILVNAYFPHLLKKLSDQTGAKLIHISTDCVFSGIKGSYAETDFKDADDVYGRSKALGEIINDKDLTIRTSIIGPELKKNGEGLFHWFMNQSGEINGYTQAYWSGVTTIELAKAIDKALKDELSGLVHLTNGDKISKYDLLNLFKQIWEKDNVTIIPYNRKSVDKSLQKSVSFNYNVPSFEFMLVELKNWMLTNNYLYKSIYNN
jgi:dTDP-4-dehydrorhamnose reductase